MTRALPFPGRTLAVISAKGGAGGTTIAANLAAALRHHQRQVVAFDLCAGNSLRLHFGMNVEDGAGLSAQILCGQPWQEAAYRSENGVHFLPYGDVSFGGFEDLFATYLEERPGWLAQRIGEIDLADDGWVLIDCPLDSEIYLRQALEAASRVWVVVSPDADCYSQLPAARRTLARLLNGKSNLHFLLNHFSPVHALDRDIKEILQAELREQLVPVTLHRDESLREAVAFKQTIFSYAPHSAAQHDFSLLAAWLLSRTEA